MDRPLSDPPTQSATPTRINPSNKHLDGGNRCRRTDVILVVRIGSSSGSVWPGVEVRCERRFHGIVDVPKGALTALGAPNAPFTAPPLSRTSQARRPAERGRRVINPRRTSNSDHLALPVSGARGVSASMVKLALLLSRELAWQVSRLLEVERRRRGTRRRSRALTCFRQAVLGLRWFRQNADVTALGRDHGVSRGYRVLLCR